jgi:L-gulono-1,4-lactone dehydrogenase
MSQLTMAINFGGNQRWYTQRYQPASETEVLDILARHSSGTIRVLGSGHSWSSVAADADVTLDLSRLDAVEPFERDGEHFVRVGAGCKLKDLLARLHGATARTLPTLGAITEQAIAGAISTGTHGSGRQSLSHFVTKIRAAVFDAEGGRPVVRELSGGPELLAARCGLGCMGVILSVELPTVPKYNIVETIRVRQSIHEILGLYETDPLTQFLLSPWGWTWVVFERAVTERAPETIGEKLNTRFFRAYNLIGQDIVFHLLVNLTRVAGAAVTKAFHRFSPALLIKDRERIDESHHMLTMKHHLFRHEEMELFVRQSDFERAMEFLRFATEAVAGSDAPLPSEWAALLGDSLVHELARLRGSYTHHYPLFCRRVLPEDTLVSMASSTDEPHISISIFTYRRPRRRKPYYAFCGFLARAFLRLFKARLHWGKHFPLQYADIAPLYPRLDEFRALSDACDPNGILRNGYTTRVLGLRRGTVARATVPQSPAAGQTRPRASIRIRARADSTRSSLVAWMTHVSDRTCSISTGLQASTMRCKAAASSGSSSSARL